jgi:acyl-CoA synthetase (AMP-forming)/AMP-acid ligase II
VTTAATAHYMPAVAIQEFRLSLNRWVCVGRAHTARSAMMQALKCSIIDRIAAVPAQAVALIDAGEHVTFGTLLSQSNALAEQLSAACSLKQGDRVAVCLPRCGAEVACMLGVLQAAAVWVPVSATWPAARQVAVLLSCSPSVVIYSSTTSLAAAITTAQCTSSIPYSAIIHGTNVTATYQIIQHVDPDSTNNHQQQQQQQCSADCMYMLYTSGTTGVEKAVQGTKLGLMNRIEWMKDTFPYSSTDITLRRTPSTFVDSIAEMLGPLITGTTLLIPPVTVGDDLALMLPLSATIIQMTFTPSLLSLLLKLAPQLSTVLPVLSICCVSGEALPMTLVHAFVEATTDKPIKLFNLYGSTECAADVSYATLSDMLQQHDNSGSNHSNAAQHQHGSIDSGSASTAVANIATIGRPIRDTTLTIVDPITLQPLPDGSVGELVVSGISVAIGYWPNTIGTTSSTSRAMTTAGADADTHTTDNSINVDDSRFINDHTTIALGLGTGRSYRTGKRTLPEYQNFLSPWYTCAYTD